MIHPLDDYPVHQSSAPLLHTISDSAGHYDRYFYNGFDSAGRIFIAGALGVYPNRQVMDAAFSVLVNGVQHNVRASRRCGRNRTSTEVGAIAVRVVHPMSEHRLTVDGRHGITADLTWRATSAVIEEPPFRRIVDGRPIFDYTRITQFGEWSGWIDIDGTRIELTDFGTVHGCRDRSWGLRNGTRGIPGPAHDRTFYWHWIPTVLSDSFTHIALNEDPAGRPWHRSGAVTERFKVGDRDVDSLVDESRTIRATGIDIGVDWSTNTRWPSSATARIDLWRAEPIELSYRPILRFQMSGIGYTHPEWGHGSWRGEFDETRDSLDPAFVDPLAPSSLHVQQVCEVTSSDSPRDPIGVAVLETLAIGPHEPSGFAGYNDGASR